MDAINDLSDEFVSSFFSEIFQQREAFVNFLFKDTNDLWKFFHFAFNCLYNLSVDKESFKILIEMLKSFSTRCL